MLSRLYSWYGKKTVRIVALIIVVLIIVTIVVSRDGSDDSDATESLRIVTVSPVASLSNDSTIELIGTVESVSQALIQSETSGRVTSVYVKPGDTVSSGQILGQLENASERAAVLQAEGVYEAALAAAAQSDSNTGSVSASLTNAENAALSTYRSALTNADNVIKNNVDVVFSDPSGIQPGLRISGLGRADEINTERKAIESILSGWRVTINAGLVSENGLLYLEGAQSDLDRIIRFIDEIVFLAADKENNNTVIDGESIQSIRTDLSTARTTINGTRSNVDASILALKTAQDALVRAQISGTTSDVSAANAQVKQALGSLRSAEANLAKTIFRSPINGTVIILNMKVGDFVGSFEEVVRVANNDALLVTTFIGESDRTRLSVGDEVLIENAFPGIVTSISPAVDQDTKKIEVKIQSVSKELLNGNTVKISVRSADTVLEDTRILVPLTAVKFSAENGSVLMVDSDGRISSHVVTIGNVSGSSVEILEGLSLSDTIIVDARGLNAGQEVDPKPAK